MTSLVTRCPQCKSAFRVVAEQLRLRDGKVRCGVCKAVFDARAHQEPAPEPAVQPAQAIPARSPAADGPPPERTVVQPAAVPHVRQQAVEAPLHEPEASAPARPPAVPPPVIRPGAVSVSQPPAVPVEQPRATPAAQLPAVSKVLHAIAPLASSDSHPEPWLPEDAVTRPVPARAGRLREPVMGAASQPATGVAHKREPVLKAGATPLPMPASTPDRHDPRLHRHTEHQISDEDFTEDDVRDDDASHERDEHHVPFVASHDDVRAYHEPVTSRGSVAQEHAHNADGFVAHGPRSGYGANLRGMRRSGLAQVFWSVCCIVAGLALVLQALWWWRTPIATHVPIMRPVYDAFCAGMGCRVGYVRVPGQLSIESSSIQPQALSQPSDKAQHMTLSAVLRNRASHAQPWPAIELTLTDFADVVVVRRMLSPAEYLAAGAPEFFAGNTEHEIAVSLSVRGAPVSGYRLALFFP